MMSAPQLQKVERISCPMCGSQDIGTTLVTFRDKRQESVPVCTGCGHFMFAETTYNYAFNVSGIAHNWASAQDLKGVIEAILKEYMPKEDVKGMEVTVQVIASYNGDQEVYE